MNAFVKQAFGEADWVGYAGEPTGEKDAAGEDIYQMPAAVRGKAGLIRYTGCGWGDASGHFDVWDGEHDKGHGYPKKCSKKEVWNLCKPHSNPNWQPFIQYLKNTNAWDSKFDSAVFQAQTALNKLASENPKFNTGRPDVSNLNISTFE